jgi:Flp pilus assembly protein TadD
MFQSLVLLISALGALVPLASATSDRIAAIQNLLAENRLAEAQSMLSRALAAQPDDAALWNLCGIADAKQGNVAHAEEAFTKAVKLAPGLVSAWLNLGRLYQLNSDRAAAIGKGIQAYQAVLRIEPENAEAHHQLALLLEWKGAFRESLEHLDRLPPEDRAKRPAVALRCADEAALGNTETALQLTDELLRDSQLEAADVIAILPAVSSRNETVALRLLEGLQSRGLATTETRSSLAAICERRGDLSGARKEYESLFRSQPPSAGVLTDLARVAWKQKDFEGTLVYLAHARDLEPNNAGIHFFFGLTCNEMHLPLEARKSLEKALALAPENPYYNYAMGVIRLEWAEKDGAIPFLKKYIAARPADARGHLALAVAYFGTSHDDDAKRELAGLTGDSQVRAGTEYLLGRIAAQEGDVASAVTHLKEVVVLEPKSSDAHAQLGDLLLEREDLEGARRETAASLALDPENYTANRTLMRLYRLANDPRLEAQTERLKTLVEEKDASLRLLQRTIEVRPW